MVLAAADTLSAIWCRYPRPRVQVGGKQGLDLLEHHRPRQANRPGFSLAPCARPSGLAAWRESLSAGWSGAHVDVDDARADDLPVLQSAPGLPTIYRFYKVLQVYGPTLKELIHEQCGDGIMSAINFRLDVKRVPDPAGDRVVVTLDGRFLPHQW
jgi:hypothetical protein